MIRRDSRRSSRASRSTPGCDAEEAARSLRSRPKHVDRLGAHARDARLELDPLAGDQRDRGIAEDARSAYEQVLFTVVRGDEAVAARCVEPFDAAGLHGNLSLEGGPPSGGPPDPSASC